MGCVGSTLGTKNVIEGYGKDNDKALSSLKDTLKYHNSQYVYVEDIMPYYQMDDMKRYIYFDTRNDIVRAYIYI